MMLTLPEKILFILAAILSLYFTYLGVDRILHILRRGHGKPDWQIARKRLVEVLLRVVSMEPTFRLRLGSSLLHAFVADRKSVV
jgi:hypothetical protein